MNRISAKRWFPHEVDLSLRDFRRSVPPNTIYQYSFLPESADDWFHRFEERIRQAIGERHLPVFRVSDGEYSFSVGYRLSRRPTHGLTIFHSARELAGYIRRRRFWVFLSGTPGYGFETYTHREWRELRPIFARQLRELAADGILAMVMFRSPDRFAEQYHRPMLRWMKNHDIALTPTNYVPFYFVYALLNGPARNRLYAGRRVLVVTSGDEGKRKALVNGLLDLGAKEVQFLPISRSKAMLDRLDLSKVNRNVDLALVGAGVGSANILAQLKPLNTVCIDAGYCLDLLAEPDRVGSRLFTMPD